MHADLHVCVPVGIKDQLVWLACADFSSDRITLAKNGANSALCGCRLAQVCEVHVLSYCMHRADVSFLAHKRDTHFTYMYEYLCVPDLKNVEFR